MSLTAGVATLTAMVSVLTGEVKVLSEGLSRTDSGNAVLVASVASLEDNKRRAFAALSVIRNLSFFDQWANNWTGGMITAELAANVNITFKQVQALHVLLR